MNKIRVRFAPSPTGALHLGGARTAIYNWLFARANYGKFFLRIEDTDQKRSRQEYIQQICESLKWLGIEWDDQIIFQSQRLSHYKRYVKKLLTEEKAYPCFCTPQELEFERKSKLGKEAEYQYSKKCCDLSEKQIEENLNAEKPFSVRLKIEEGWTSWKDVIYKKISVNNNEIDDFIIQRPNGFPTYQLAVVIDDIDMAISHIIRGEDHISNTPKQINIFKAFGITPPLFAHLPLLFGKDEKRLSKRHGATGIDEFRNMGYPPRAIVNYLALLGWAPKDNREILDADSIIRQFELNRIARKPAVFDIKKLDWLSGKHFSLMSSKAVCEVVIPMFLKASYLTENSINDKRRYSEQVIDLLKTKVRNYHQFVELGRYFFIDPSEYDVNVANKCWKNIDMNYKILFLKNKLADLEIWDEENLEKVIRSTADILEMKAGELIHPLRLLLTGVGVSPGVFEVAGLLGKETVMRRIDNALNKLPLKGNDE